MPQEVLEYISSAAPAGETHSCITLIATLFSRDPSKSAVQLRIYDAISLSGGDTAKIGLSEITLATGA